MAIEIIERGIKPENRKFTATCNGCKTKIRFLQSDGEVKYDQRDGTSVRVTCPECNKFIYVDINSYDK